MGFRLDVRPRQDWRNADVRNGLLHQRTAAPSALVRCILVLPDSLRARAAAPNQQAQLDRNATTGAAAACQDGRASSRSIHADTFGVSAMEICAGLA
jgi:hypothetical protein